MTILEKSQFAARHKDSGKLVYFKSREALQNALKAGTHEDPGAKNDPDRKGKPVLKKPAVKGTNVFQQEPKSADADSNSNHYTAGDKSGSVPKLKDLMPNLDNSKKGISQISPLERQQISTIIDKLAELGNQAKEKGEKAPNFNLCQVSIPGTNLYCDGNKGIPREDMPQFKGTPVDGSPGSRLPKNDNGEVDTEQFFKKMLENQGIKVSGPVPISPDKLKATQSELVGVKVAGMAKALGEGNPKVTKKLTAPIYVSNDGYVLDGHHRWAAIVAHNAANPKKQLPMNVLVIDEPIVPLVHRANKFAERMGIRAKAADTSVKEDISKLGSLVKMKETAGIDMNQYADDFQRAMEGKWKNKKALQGNWILYIDNHLGTFEWTNLKTKLVVMATPFWDGEANLPIDVVGPDGEEILRKVLPFKPANNPHRDEKKYFELLLPYLRKYTKK